MVQGCTLFWLWKSLPATCEAGLCSTDSTLFYVCITSVFVTSLTPGLRFICSEVSIIKLGTLIFRAGKVLSGFHELSRPKLGVALAYLTVLWAAVLLVGVNYTLSAETLGDLVQAAVAITFINELDDMAVFLYGEGAKLAEVTYVRCKVQEGLRPRSLRFLSTRYTIPVIASVSFGIIYGTHSSYC